MSRCPKCLVDYPEHVMVCPVDAVVLNENVHRAPTEFSNLDVGRAPTEFANLDDESTARALDALEAPTRAPTSRSMPTRVMGSAATSEALTPGFAVGDYEIVRPIGSGGMAAVYAGVHPVIGKEVAIKVLSRVLSSDRSMVERFIQEARAVNQIRHHNIVDIFAIGELPDGRAYCVMELLTGETLKERLDKGTPTYQEAISILSQVCEGLDAAHRANIVHRDLKPDNVFVVSTSRGPTVKILDFGIAKLLGGNPDAQQRTNAGILIGTPEYMSPEQCAGSPIDTRTDIYLLGVMFYEVFTGRLPFSTKTPMETINAHISERPIDPDDYAELPPQLRALMLACLAKDPKDRPQTALDVRDRLVAALPATATVAPTPITRTSQQPRPPKQKKGNAMRVLGAAAILALAAVGLYVVVDHFRATPAVATVVDAAGSAAPSAETLALQIISSPPGATVTIQGQAQTLRTPYVYKVPWATRLAIRIELAGHQPNVQDIAVAEGETEKLLEVALVPIVVSAPVDASTTKDAAAPAKVPKGAPSVIAELQVSPSTAWAGEKTTVTGTIKFTDADADVVAIRTEVKGQGQLATPLRVSGAKTGTAAFTLIITPKKAGQQSIDVWVVDAGENVSNRLTGAVEVLEREAATPPPDAPIDGPPSM